MAGIIDPVERLKGKTCLVTGAASGIGRGVAQVFAAQGAQVVLTDIAADGLAETVAELGESVVADHVADLSKEEAVTELFDQKIAPLKKLDGVVCAHGLLDLNDGKLEDHQTEVFERTLRINLFSCYFTTRASIPFLRASGCASIVLISSLAALRTPSAIAYGATKGALNAMAKTISGQYAASGIRCNVICPGSIETPMLMKFREARGAEPPQNHVKRIGEPHDIGYAAAFLCSDESSYITATVQVVDGGLAQH